MIEYAKPKRGIRRFWSVFQRVRGWPPTPAKVTPPEYLELADRHFGDRAQCVVCESLGLNRARDGGVETLECCD